MPRAKRSHQIDYATSQVYHVVSRCTRQIHLLGTCEKSRAERKGLMLCELERLARSTAVGVAGFAVMDNHVHLLLKVDVASAKRWSARHVAERWLSLHPPRNGYFKVVDVSDEHIAALCADAEKIEACREKLMSISQFMKELKQEVAQKINRLEETQGPIWAGRFKCKAVMSEEQLLATMAYIDLNPFAANTVDLPEEGKHTTLDARLHGVETASADESVADTSDPSGLETPKASCPASPPAKPIRRRKSVKEATGWWLSIESSPRESSPRESSPRFSKTSSSASSRRQSQVSPRCILPEAGLTFWAYLRLIDATSRLIRKGKRRLAGDADPISDRLHASPRSLVDNYLNGWLTGGIKWAGVPALMDPI